MLEYYNNYLTTMAKSPIESWREAQQEAINQLFEDTTLLTMVEEEEIPFNFSFHKIDVWVDTVTESTLNAEKDDSDYRAIFFKDCEHQSMRGRYYRFSDNYWIVYSDPCTEDVMASQKLRRCNNWLKWVDKDTGVLYEYPCVVDYSLSSTNAQTARLIQQANSHVTVIVQDNENTLNINRNARFLFNGTAYRFFAINNYMQNNYVDQNTPILFYDFYEEMIIDTDNLTDNIADDIRENFTLSSTVDSISNIYGYSGTLEITAYNQTTVMDSPSLTYTSSDTSVVTVDDDGNYTIVGETGDTATITVQITNNDTSAIEIAVTVVDELSDNYIIKLSDIPSKLKQGDTLTIQAELYNNDESVEEDITCTPSWIDTTYYTLYQTADNTWELTSIKPNSNSITLTFSCSTVDVETQKSIKLTAMW